MLIFAPWRHGYHTKQLAREDAQLWHGHWIDSGRIETLRNERHLLSVIRYISGNKDIELKKKKRLCRNLLWLVDVFRGGKNSEENCGMYLEHLCTDCSKFKEQ